MKLDQFARGDVISEVLRKEFVHCIGSAKIDVMDLNIEKVTSALMRSIDEVAYSLNGYVWAQDIQNETVTFCVQWPATWWQHLKQRWFPSWVIRRWPVAMSSKTETHEFKTVALLPEFKYSAPRGTGQAVIKTQVRRVP